jgi:hypothetical protein
MMVMHVTLFSLLLSVTLLEQEFQASCWIFAGRQDTASLARLVDAHADVLACYAVLPAQVSTLVCFVRQAA